MRFRAHIKDYRHENRLFIYRAIQATVFVVLLLAILVTRLVYLQVYQHETYSTLSKENRVKLVAVPPTRGLIFDRKGKLLAESQPSYSLEITPERVKDLNKTIDELAKLVTIDDIDRKRFYRTKARRPSFEGIPIRLKLTDEEVASIAVNLHKLAGVEIVAGLVRHYPRGTHAAHAIGYVGRISEKELQTFSASKTANYRATNHIGKSGIEKEYEDLLHGKVGAQQVEINARGRVLRKLESVPAIPGKNLYLTIDSDLQKIAEDALGEENGAVVAIVPKTGEVLVFASQPGYEPNLFVNGIDHKTYRAYSDDENRPLYNRPLYGRYPPGSTIKPFVALAGLETSTIGLEHSTYCPGFYQLPGNKHKYRCWKHSGHGTVGINKAIVNSCDVFFYDLARSMKIDPLHDYMVKFGFGKKTGIDLLDTQFEPSGLFPSRAWKRQVHQLPWYPGETLIAGIGQGFTLTTPLQLASATATLANGGKRIKPHMLREVEDIQTSERITTKPEVVDTIAHEDDTNWQQVFESMRQVVHSPTGTARKINKDLKYMIAGKTGTAQVIGIKQDEKYDEESTPKKFRDHALFVAFAPVESPEIAVAVIVENAGHGGAVAAPVAAKVIKAWLDPMVESGQIQPMTEQEAARQG
jgi:penicillin-binding protein 2